MRESRYKQQLPRSLPLTRTPIMHSYLLTIPLEQVRETSASDCAIQLKRPGVAHGGFLASLIFRTVQKHFDSTLKKYDQPHVYNLHINFVRPETAGNASLKVQDVKPGPSISVTHVTLEQNGKERVVAYAS